MKKQKNLKKEYSYFELIKKLVPCRFYVILLLIVFFGITIGRLFNNESIKLQYFWILSSLVQGFSAFFGVVIAIITFRLTYISDKRINLFKLVMQYLLPIMLTVLTIIYSIFGMVFYTILESYNLLGQVIFISSLFATWSFIEILKLLIDSIYSRLL